MVESCILAVFSSYELHARVILELHWLARVPLARPAACTGHDAKTSRYGSSQRHTTGAGGYPTRKPELFSQLSYSLCSLHAEVIFELHSL